MNRTTSTLQRRLAAVLVACSTEISGFTEEGDPSSNLPIAEQLQQLRRQNAALQEQLRRQQQTIEELGRRVEQSHPAAAPATEPQLASASNAENEVVALTKATAGRIHLTGDGAVAFFTSQSRGQFPNSSFHVDEARILLEAPVWKDVYLFSELLLYEREVPKLNLRAGEFYLDAENLSRLWGHEGQLNLRAGRVNVPFGDEYLRRHPQENPLISHSLMDIWGVNEGVEAYGSLGRFSYVVAVQNGPVDQSTDFTGDKMITARISYEPTSWLHLSGSASRTGTIHVKSEKFSALWIGSGFIRSIGSPATTLFQADLLQADAALHFSETTLRAAGGMLAYSDNDPFAGNDRQIVYYTLEAVQPIHEGFHAAVRWSQVFSSGGYTVPGIGNAAAYAFGSLLTSELHLLSLGFGYRWSPQLLFKVEYSIQSGETSTHTERDHENLFGATAAFTF